MEKALENCGRELSEPLAMLLHSGSLNKMHFSKDVVTNNLQLILDIIKGTLEAV